MSENIYTRINIKHVNGADLLFVYDFNILSDLNIQVNHEFDERYFSKGSALEIDNKKYIIKDFYVVLYNETNQPHNFGINLHRIGDMLPFNMELQIYVEESK